jgi:hypothetical protein
MKHQTPNYFHIPFDFAAHSQSEDLDLHLDSISSVDSNNERIFTIHYQIKNKTDQTMSFSTLIMFDLMFQTLSLDTFLPTKESPY